MKKHSQQHGFTLIELLVTVAVLAVLTSIAIPAYNGYITAAKMTEAKNNIAALKLAEEEFFLENNTYFHNDGGTDNVLLASRSLGLWSPSKGDDGNVNFTYSVSSSSSGYSILATGKSSTKVAGETESYSK